MTAPRHIDLGRAAVTVAVKRDGQTVAESKVKTVSFHGPAGAGPHAEWEGDVTLAVRGDGGPPFEVVFDLRAMHRALGIALGDWTAPVGGST